jgi:inosose dehydratase
MSPQGIATALYGWMERYKRDRIEWDWDLIYRECAEAGVDGVETNPDPDRLRLLRSLGLQVSASYVGLPLVLGFDDLDIERTVMPVAARLAEAGGTNLVVNSDAVDWSVPVRKTVEDAARQGDALSRIAERVRGLGLTVCLHNHAADYDNAQLDLDSVIRFADPAVGLCVDTGWAYVADHDPVQWVREHSDRVHYFHVRNQRGKVPTEDVTDGEISMAEILAAAPDYSGWLTLELWHPNDMEPERTMQEDTRRSVQYLRSLSAS